MEKVKASYHSQKGGYSLEHNDGSMYGRDGAEHAAGRPKCVHYSPKEGGGFDEVTGAEKAGLSVREAKAWYEEHLRREYEAALESTSWKKNPSRRCSFEEFCDQKRNQFTESIFQVGGKESPDKDLMRRATRYGYRAVNAYIEELNESAERAGIKARVHVVTADEHNDEASSHVHELTAFVDEAGKMNANGCLEALGFEKAKPPRKMVQRKGQRPRPETKKEYERRCTRVATYSACVRKVFEDAVDEFFEAEGLGLKLDRERGDAAHLSVPEFKAVKEREEALNAREEALNVREAELNAMETTAVTRKQDLDKRELTLDERERTMSERLHGQLREELNGWREGVREALTAALAPLTRHVLDAKRAGRAPSAVVTLARKAILAVDEALAGATLEPVAVDGLGGDMAAAVAGVELAQREADTGVTAPTPELRDVIEAARKMGGRDQGGRDL